VSKFSLLRALVSSKTYFEFTTSLKPAHIFVWCMKWRILHIYNDKCQIVYQIPFIADFC